MATLSITTITSISRIATICAIIGLFLGQLCYLLLEFPYLPHLLCIHWGWVLLCSSSLLCHPCTSALPWCPVLLAMPIGLRLWGVSNLGYPAISIWRTGFLVWIIWISSGYPGILSTLLITGLSMPPSLMVINNMAHCLINVMWVLVKLNSSPCIIISQLPRTRFSKSSWCTSWSQFR